MYSRAFCAVVAKQNAEVDIVVGEVTWRDQLQVMLVLRMKVEEREACEVD